MATPVRVAIVDDSAVMRRGISALLEVDEGVVVVGEAGDGDEALALADRESPDIVLLDVRMPRRDGVSVVRELSARCRVLMLTFSDETDIIRRALDEGAVGYLVHGTFDADSLAAMVRTAAAGTTALSGPALTAVLSPAAPARRTGEEWGLSARQAEVMDLVSRGQNNRAIAQGLFLTEKTVKNHINQIFAKLGASSRGEAIATWLGTTTV